MPQVSIVMGSDSDMSVMSKAAEMLDRFGITYEMKIISAHRELSQTSSGGCRKTDS